MLCSVMEYAQSVVMKKPVGNDSSQAGRQVFFIATQSLVFPGAARQKKRKRQSVLKGAVIRMRYPSNAPTQPSITPQ